MAKHIMQLDSGVILGDLTLNNLKTTLSAPNQTGTIRMVTTDQNGFLGFQTIPTGGAGGGENLQQTLDLGSTLTSTETISVGSNYLGIVATGTNQALLVQNNNTGSGSALYVEASGTNGLLFNTYGNTVAIKAEHSNATTNTVNSLLNLTKTSSGTVAAGFGVSIDFNLENNANVVSSASKITSKWLSASNGSQTSQLEISNHNAGSPDSVGAIFKGDRQLQLPGYAGNTFGGTAAYSLGVDSSGNVITFSPSGGGGSNWTITGSDLYRNSKVRVGSTTAPANTFDVSGTLGVTGESYFLNSLFGSVKIQVGAAVDSNTSTPVFFSAGGQYGRNGSIPALKMRLYDNGTNNGSYGFGMGNSSLDYYVVGGGTHDFFIGASTYLQVTNAGIKISSLDTDGTAPGQTGTVKMVTTDGTGTLSFQNIPSGGTGGDGGVLSIATIGSSPNTSGGSISGTVLTLQPASATVGGVIAATAQSFPVGTKTFKSQVVIDGDFYGDQLLIKGLNGPRMGFSTDNTMSFYGGVGGIAGYAGLDFGTYNGTAITMGSAVYGIALKLPGAANNWVQIPSLDTDLTAPTQTGTVRMVTTDGTGTLSFQAIPSGSGSSGTLTGDGVQYRVPTYSSSQNFVNFDDFTYDYNNIKFKVGSGNTVGSTHNYAIGQGNALSAHGAHTLGGYNSVSGQWGSAIGLSNTISGTSASTLGTGLYSRSYGETSVGAYNTDYTPVSASGWNSADRVFTIGNGADGSRQNAMIVYKSGNVNIIKLQTGNTAPGTSGTTKMVITDANGQLSFADIPSGGSGGTTETASNGLNKSGNDIRLGGTLFQATTVTTGNNILSFESASTSGSVQALNTGGGSAFYAAASGGSGFGNAIHASAGGTGAGLLAESYGGPALRGQVFGTNGSRPVMELYGAYSSPTNGDGVTIDFRINTTLGQGMKIANQIGSQWTNVSGTNNTSYFYVTGTNNGNSERIILSLNGPGQMQISEYGNGSFFSGSPTYALGVDSQGNVVEYTPQTGGSSDGNNFPTAVTQSTNGTITISRSGIADISSAAASGTWGINITGNAATFTNQQNSATIAASVAANGNQIVLRDGNGDINSRYAYSQYNNTTDDVNSGTISYVMAKFGDSFHRSASATKVKDFIVTTSGGGTTNFLRADGTWATPSGGSSTNPAGNNTEIQYNNSGVFGANQDYTWNNSTKILRVKGQIIQQDLSRRNAGSTFINANTEAAVFTQVLGGDGSYMVGGDVNLLIHEGDTQFTHHHFAVAGNGTTGYVSTRMSTAGPGGIGASFYVASSGSGITLYVTTGPFVGCNVSWSYEIIGVPNAFLQ